LCTLRRRRVMLWVAAARTRAPGGVLHVSEPDESRQFASSPCYMHELGTDWERVKAWRSERRKRLLKQRLGVDSDTRRNLNRVIVTQLTELLDARAYPILGFYWPIRGEIDVRELARIHLAAGGKTALPVIVTRHAAVEFWEWHPGVATERGVLDIPVPRERRILIPDVLIIPLLGFDRAYFRLGYGGGYYDRTLAAATPRPLAVGIASVDAELHTIHPQPHDVPMDVIVTDQFVLGADAVGRRGRPGK
jgi:5-formyltetrahydrofolate cyclo-ligase